MSGRLSFVLLTPCAVAKGRTGGILSRLLSRSGLDLVGAQMLCADETFAKGYAAALRGRSTGSGQAALADYVERNLAPSEGGKARPGMLLLFRGESPCERLLRVCGRIGSGRDAGVGRTIRDTFADAIPDPGDPGRMAHFEPAVLTPETQAEADEDLRRIAGFLDGKANLPEAAEGERTLVIIKPDNWTFRSARPGGVIDMFDGAGLRIVGAKVHRFSLAQALEFYGPVEAMLKEKLSGMFGKKARELLEREFRVAAGEETARALAETFGADCAAGEFAQLVEFMSGRSPVGRSREELDEPGSAMCMILVYEGESAVARIRETLGPTNPADAPEGTVRREFGESVMVNAAHASDSAESFLREKGIAKMGENALRETILSYLG